MLENGRVDGLARKWRTGMGHDDVELLVDVDDADLNLDAV